MQRQDNYRLTKNGEKVIGGGREKKRVGNGGGDFIKGKKQRGAGERVLEPIRELEGGALSTGKWRKMKEGKEQEANRRMT